MGNWYRLWSKFFSKIFVKFFIFLLHAFCILPIYISLSYRHINAYIIGHYNASVRITTQLLTPFMLCALILYMNGGTYNLESTPNDRFLRSFFLSNVMFSQSFWQKSAERKSPKNNFHIFAFKSDLWFELGFMPCSDRHFYWTNRNRCHYWDQYFI